MFTGKLTDAGTHNSFADAFHRSWNNLNGDLWRSQSDATITNHVYTGIGLGHVRGVQDEWQTDVPGTPRQLPKRLAVGTGRRDHRPTTLAVGRRAQQCNPIRRPAVHHSGRQ